MTGTTPADTVTLLTFFVSCSCIDEIDDGYNVPLQSNSTWTRMRERKELPEDGKFGGRLGGGMQVYKDGPGNSGVGIHRGVGSGHSRGPRRKIREKLVACCASDRCNTV